MTDKPDDMGCYNPRLNQEHNGFLACKECINFNPLSITVSFFKGHKCEEFLCKFGFVKIRRDAYERWRSINQK